MKESTKLYDEIISELMSGLETKSFRIVVESQISLGTGMGRVLVGVNA